MTDTQQSEVDDIVAHLTRVATQSRDPNVLVPLKNGHYLGIRFDHLLAALAALRLKVSEAEMRSVKERLRANAVHCLSDAERRTLATECLDLFDRLKGEKA